MICRPVSTQFMQDNVIAMFELTLEDEQIRIVKEKHYQLVLSKDILRADLEQYKIWE